MVARFGARRTHAVCLAASGTAMLLFPGVSTPLALFVLLMAFPDIALGLPTWVMGPTSSTLADFSIASVASTSATSPRVSIIPIACPAIDSW